MQRRPDHHANVSTNAASWVAVPIQAMTLWP
jgi:hypothetical protein